MSSIGKNIPIVIGNSTPIVIGNAQKKFRDGFAAEGTQPDPAVWDLVNDSPTEHIVNVGGDAMSAAYIRISLSPFLTDSGVSITTKDIFGIAFRVGYGLSISQRILGQETGMEMVGVDTNDTVTTMTPVVDKTITGTTISITTNVGTVTLTGHGLKGGDRICIHDCPDSRLNVGPVVVTGLTADTFSVPITLANGSYDSTGGHVKWDDPLIYVKNGASLLCESTSATTASFVTRRNGSSMRSVSSTISTTTATQANTSPYTDAFLTASNHELFATLEEIIYRSYASDGIATMSGLGKRTQSIPDEEYNYKIRVRAKNLRSLTVPVAKILTADKSGTTTATIVTNVAHGLTTADWVQIYGIRDITNFPNLVAQTQVASIVNSTTFTIVMTGAVTASSAGGVIWRVQGSNLAPGVLAQNVQSISRTNNILSVVGNTTWATPLPGEYYHLYGMNGDAAAYDGAYKVLRVNTSTLELESIGANFGLISCGGTAIKRTDVRIHFVRVLDYTRLVTEIMGGRGNTTDVNNAVPVSIAGSATLTVTSSAAGTIADDATSPGSPVMIGGSAVETDGTDPTSVSAEADAARCRTDRNRRLLVSEVHPNLWSVTGTYTVAQTNLELKAAPGASLSLYITDIVVSNGATAGTVKFVQSTASSPVDKISPLYLPINGFITMQFLTPIRITANTNFGITSVTCTTHSVILNGFIMP